MLLSSDNLVAHYTYTLSCLGSGWQVPESKLHLGHRKRGAQTRTVTTLGFATRPSFCCLLLSHFCRPDGGEADQRLPLPVRRSCRTHCLNESSSSLFNRLAGPAGEVTRQQIASDFPSLRMVLPLWLTPPQPQRRLASSSGAGKERDEDW